MYEPTINYIAVLGSAIIFFMIGGLWYSPVLFAKPWIKAIGLSDDQMTGMKEKGPGAKPMIISFTGGLVMAFVTAHMVDFMKVVFEDSGMSHLTIGLTTGFWMWLGYIATFSLNSVSYENKPWSLYFINNGYQLVGLFSMGSILAVWG
ncbi:MAG: DUF1761 domain-containing protein [Fidelibacterota bacterium]